MPGCGCNLAACCANPGDPHPHPNGLACQLINRKPEFQSICNAVRSGARDGAISVCDMEEVKTGPLTLLFSAERADAIGPASCVPEGSGFSECFDVDGAKWRGWGEANLQIGVPFGVGSISTFGFEFFDGELCASVRSQCTDEGEIVMSITSNAEDCKEKTPNYFFGPEMATGGGGRLGACTILDTVGSRAGTKRRGAFELRGSQRRRGPGRGSSVG